MRSDSGAETEASLHDGGVAAWATHEPTDLTPVPGGPRRPLQPGRPVRASGQAAAHRRASSATVPTAPCPTTSATQVEVVWSSIGALLSEAGLAVADIVSITTYVVAGNDLSVVMAARDRAMAGHLPASTLIVVPSLARPEWKVEIAVVAAA